MPTLSVHPSPSPQCLQQNINSDIKSCFKIQYGMCILIHERKIEQLNSRIYTNFKKKHQSTLLRPSTSENRVDIFQLLKIKFLYPSKINSTNTEAVSYYFYYFFQNFSLLKDHKKKKVHKGLFENRTTSRVHFRVYYCPELQNNTHFLDEEDKTIYLSFMQRSR